MGKQKNVDTNTAAQSTAQIEFDSESGGAVTAQQKETRDPPDESAAGGVKSLSKYLKDWKQSILVVTGASEERVNTAIHDVLFAIDTSKGGKFDLRMARPKTVYQVVIDCVKMDIRIDGRNFGYLVGEGIYEDSGNSGGAKHFKKLIGIRCALHIGYLAFIRRMREIYPTFDYTVIPIYDGDVFEFGSQNGVDHYRYVPADPFRDDYQSMRGIAFHFTYRNVDGSQISKVERVPISEITKGRNKAKSDDVWKEWFYQQAVKFAIRRALKRSFKTELQPLLGHDDTHFDMDSDEESYEQHVLPRPDIRRMIAIEKKQLGITQQEPTESAEVEVASSEDSEQKEAATVENVQPHSKVNDELRYSGKIWWCGQVVEVDNESADSLANELSETLSTMSADEARVAYDDSKQFVDFLVSCKRIDAITKITGALHQKG